MKRWPRVAGLLAATGAALASVPSHAGPRVRYDGDAIVALDAASAAQVRSHMAVLDAMGIEVLNDHPGPTLLARVPALARAALDATGLAYRIVDPDLQASLDLERARVDARDPLPGDAEEGWDNGYRDWEEVQARIEALAAAAPAITTAFDVGTTVEGRTIRALRIERNPEAPVVLINAAQHAREWLSITTALIIAESIVDAAAEAETSVALLDPAVTARLDALLDEVAFIIIPVVNPDGYVHTWQSDRLWRKNKRGEEGVDLNRNWGLAWGGPGSSGDPESNNFRGAAAFSEPESAAVRDLMLGESRLIAHLDVHCYSQLVLYPWGFGEDFSPDDDLLSGQAAELAQTMTDAFGEPYEPRRAGTWYAASGNMPDWAYGILGLHSFTIELRPADADPSSAGFIAPASEIAPTGHEALLAVMQLATWTASLPPLPPGDDGSALPDDETDSGSGDSTTTGSTTESGEPPPDPAESTGPPPSTSTGVAAGTEGGTGSDAAPATDAASGCGCRAQSPPTWTLGWGLVLAATARRRRRAPAS